MSIDDGRVISNFIVQSLRGEDLTIYGDGRQTRSFCYVDNLIDGIWRMMNGPDDFVGPVNLGNQEENSILELAEKIIAMTGSHSKITYHSLPENDPVRRKPDITLAREKLDWQPTTPIDDGLERTIEYFRGILVK